MINIQNGNLWHQRPPNRRLTKQCSWKISILSNIGTLFSQMNYWGIIFISSYTHIYIYIYMLNLDSSIQAQYIYFLSLQLHLAMKRALKTIFADFKSLIITLILLQCITKQLNPLRQGCLDHRFKEPYFLFAGGNQRNIWLLFAEVLMMGMKVTFFKLLLQEGSEVMVSDLEPTEAALGWFW